MTGTILESIDTVHDLGLFADAYKKGYIKLNISRNYFNLVILKIKR